METKIYEAVVEKIIPQGDHGPYAVASCPKLGLVTFSLEPPVWEEEDWPEGGNIVILSTVRKKRAGWRAKHARFLQPSDEQSTDSESGRRNEK